MQKAWNYLKSAVSQNLNIKKTAWPGCSSIYIVFFPSTIFLCSQTWLLLIWFLFILFSMGLEKGWSLCPICELFKYLKNITQYLHNPLFREWIACPQGSFCLKQLKYDFLVTSKSQSLIIFFPNFAKYTSEVLEYFFPLCTLNSLLWY